MKTMRRITLAGLWILMAAVAHGQVSTFPSPPPLTPPADNAGTTPNSTAISPAPVPSASPATPPANDSAAAATPGSPATIPTNTAPAKPVAAETLTSMAALNDKDLLQPGDTISFRVIEDRDKAVPLVVTDTGEVEFPYIGRVKVQGKTCHQVAVEVKKLLEVDYYKQATAIVGLDIIYSEDKTKPRNMAWVVGEVKQVGPLELVKAQPMTVSQIILRAGGFADFADQRKVKVIHRTSKSSDPNSTEMPDISDLKDAQIIDVKSVFDGKSTVDPVVRTGDYIIVPKKILNW